jgi:hypothetical protein
MRAILELNGGSFSKKSSGRVWEENAMISQIPNRSEAQKPINESYDSSLRMPAVPCTCPHRALERTGTEIYGRVHPDGLL